MRYCRSLFAVSLLAVAACADPELRVGSENYGVIYLDAEGAGGGVSVSPVATFFRSPPLGIATSVSPSDSCILAAFVDTFTSIANTTDIDAGSAIKVNLSGDSVSLVPFVQPGIRTYRISGAGELFFVPGDTALITIPGADGGFVATTIAARTADAYTRSALPVPAANEGIDLTWTPDTRPGSSMLVSLRYNAAGSSVLNLQVFCTLIDDGSFRIPSDRLTGWRAGTVRDAVTSRWRTQVKQIGNSFVIVSSTYSLRGLEARP